MLSWLQRLWQRANLSDRMYLVFFVALSAAILLLRHRVPGWPSFLALHAFALAFIITLVLNSHRVRYWSTMHDWYPLAMPILTFEEVAVLNFLFVDGWRDQWLLRFEARLFPEPPTVWLSRFASPVVTEILQVGYFSYFLLLIIVGGVLYRRADKRPFYGVMAASVLSYLLCYVVFLALPTEGPRHTLRALHTVPLEGGPFHWAVTTIQNNAGVHGNAFPSAHVAGAVAALFFAWKFAPRLGAWLTPLVVLLCIGAVYDRYHYFSDVAAGIPVGLVASRLTLHYQRNRPAPS